MIVNHSNQGRPKIINISIGGRKNMILNEAVNAAVRSHVLVVTAAGNNG
jgi:subtilisin family serine protease